MELKKVIDLIRSVDVAAQEEYAPFNRDGVIDIEGFMQVFVQDVFEDMDFMSQPFLDAVEVLVGIYHSMASLAPEAFAGLHHKTVDDFRHYGFKLEDRTVTHADEPEDQRIIVTDRVILIIERYGRDDSPSATALAEEIDDDDL